ncbi:MAG: DNA replication/repair protein RecF [Flavipsychrobacter sp.]|nr:DNA replication/repair protein RecF [Flavipsychrobacter sp.]
MNTIKNITLVQFRNYSSASFHFPQPITCITGPNGSGKTNLLDAVYYLCYTKSYFTSLQQNNVQKGMDGFRVQGTLVRAESEDRGADGDAPSPTPLRGAEGPGEVIICKWKQGKKELSADGVEYEKLTDHIGKYAAVMIAPDDMELINDGSELRRKWVDSILSQTDREYLERLIRYQKVLLQRNAWLKMHFLNPPSDSPELEHYNRVLSEDGAYIYQKRHLFISSFMPLLQAYYQELSGGKERIDVVYESALAQQGMWELLEHSFQNDLRMQRTTRGVHRDDWTFLQDGAPVKQFGSQGQKKSFLFAMKLAQYTYLHQVQRHKPILLLDDIFEKLDQSRMEALLRIIRGPAFGQVILTDTHAGRVEQAFGGREGIEFIEL